MPQQNIWNYYSICKKKLDRLHAKKLNKNLNQSNLERNVTEKQLITNKNKSENDLQIVNRGKPRRLTCAKNYSPIKQAKLAIDNETRQIILKSNTIIDQVKSLMHNQNNLNGNKDDFIFKRPISPAPRVKRRNDLLERKSFSVDSKAEIRSPTHLRRFKSSILLESQQLINSCGGQQTNSSQSPASSSPTLSSSHDTVGLNESRVRKRLFESSGLEDVKDKLTTNSTDDFLNKLRSFQDKTSIATRFNISYYSPSKRMKEQADEAAAKCKKDITSYSPQKYLENRLKSLSPKTSCTNKSSSSILTENSPPFKIPSTSQSSVFSTTTTTPTKTSCSTYLSPKKSSNLFKSPLKCSSPHSKFNLNSFALNSPFKSPIRPPSSPRNGPTKSTNELSLPDTYLELARSFVHLDTIVTRLYAHSKTCTFDNVKLAMAKLMKKEFELRHLAQIMTIEPTAFDLSYDLINQTDRRLVIKPNAEHTCEYSKARLQERFIKFKKNLYCFAKKVHCEYLLSLEKPIMLDDDQQLKRWHPSFQFPDIPQAELPKLENDLSHKEDDQSNQETIQCSPTKLIDDRIEIVFEEPNDEI